MKLAGTVKALEVTVTVTKTIAKIKKVTIKHEKIYSQSFSPKHFGADLFGHWI